MQECLASSNQLIVKLSSSSFLARETIVQHICIIFKIYKINRYLLKIKLIVLVCYFVGCFFAQFDTFAATNKTMWTSFILFVELLVATYSIVPPVPDSSNVYGGRISSEDGIDLIFEDINGPMSEDRPQSQFDSTNVLEYSAKTKRESLHSAHRSRQRRSEFKYPPREGSPTLTHSCSYVRAVPDNLRNPSEMRPDGLKQFYQKYTEAYNIPVVASSKVPDDALKRACYVVRFMFADHSGVRREYFRRHGRVAVKADSERITQLPEYSFLSSAWDVRARAGLGATDVYPVCSGKAMLTKLNGWSSVLPMGGGDSNTPSFVNIFFHD